MDSNPVKTVDLLESISFEEKKKIWGKMPLKYLVLMLKEEKSGPPNRSRRSRETINRLRDGSEARFYSVITTTQSRQHCKCAFFPFILN